MGDALFSSEFEPADTRHFWRLWFADLLDLATSALLGWAALRALDVERTPKALVVAGGVAWLLLSVAGGLSGWTPWRGVMGVRMETDGGVPGPVRGLGRAFLALVELPLSPFLQRRHGDRLLKVQPERVPVLTKKWQRGLVWQGFWLLMVFASVWFMVMPTKTEAFTYLKKLDGWRCCHRETPPSPFKCSTSVSRAVSEAEDGDARAQAIVADCPRAAARMGR